MSTINFNQPDGTPASNLSNSQFTITATEQARYHVFGVETISIFEGKVINGALEVFHPQIWPSEEEGIWLDFIRNEISINFHVPIQTLNFEVATFRHGVYIWTAQNHVEMLTFVANTPGNDHDYNTFHQVSLTAPAGFVITDLHFLNADQLAGSAAVKIDNLTFDAPSALVSEDGYSLLLLLGALVFTKTVLR